MIETIAAIPAPIWTGLVIGGVTVVALVTIVVLETVVAVVERLVGLLVAEIEAEAADEAAPVRRRRDELTVGERRRRRA